MARSLCWKDEYTDYLREIGTDRWGAEVTKMVNDKFGTNYTKSQVDGVRKRLGLVGKPIHGLSLTKEQHEFLVSVNHGREAKEVADLLNSEFGLTWTAKRVKIYRGNHNLKSGLTGRFEKGHTPQNKGKKYPNMPPNRGQFRKGNKPRNWVPVGTVSYTTDGYPRVKTAEPDRWEFLHRQTWERYYGPIPDGHVVVFLDRDKTNWGISNLACVSNAEMATLNKKRLLKADAELTQAGLCLVRLQRRIKELENDN